MGQTFFYLFSSSRPLGKQTKNSKQKKGVACDGSNDQLGGVSATIVKTGAEDWKELLCEVTSSEGVEFRPGIHIVEGDFTLLVVDKHTPTF